MKKIFTLVSGVMMALMMNAQGIVYSPMIDALRNPLSMVPEAMSANRAYVVGLNDDSSAPVVWKTADNTFAELYGTEWVAYLDNVVYATKWEWQYEYDWETGAVLDSAYVEVEDYDVILSADTVWQEDPLSGSLHAINNNGLAVGEFGLAGQGKAIMWNIADGVEYTSLYSEEGEDGSSAWAVSADGSVIAGFYFDADWNTKACVWTNNGTTRVDLPLPSDDAAGFSVAGAEARWMSAEGSVILGFLIDFNTYKWVMAYWTKDANGSYTVHAEHARQYYCTIVDGWTAANTNPYFNFEPSNISEDGNWLLLAATPQYDLNDWDALELRKALRINLSTGEIQELDYGLEQAPDFFAVANDGTAVGRKTMDLFGAEVKAVIWKSGTTSHVTTLANVFPAEVAEEGSTGLAAISGDGSTVLGRIEYTTTDGEYVSSRAFLAPIGEVCGVESVESQPVVEGIYDLMGRRYAEMPAVNGVYIVNGVKVVK